MIENSGKLKGVTLFITGASRGIGKAIALKAAKDGANIVIAAKTAEPHPKLPGTIFTAAKEIEDAGGKALPCIVDVRDEASINEAVNKAVQTFGGIDIVVNNASAISLTGTIDTSMKKYDLMHHINTRGTFLTSKLCVPHLMKSKNPHILNISPPLNMNPVWFKDNVAYTMSKYGMSMCALGMAEEFKPHKIAVNTLWPRTVVITAAMEMLGGLDISSQCRKPEIMADAAYAILTKDSASFTGNFVVDDDLLRKEGVTNFDCYAVEPGKDLLPDFFLDKTDEPQNASLTAAQQIDQVFSALSTMITPDIIKRTNAVYLFKILGNEKRTWFIDLKRKGTTGKGRAPTKPDVTFSMTSENLIKMLQGSLKPSNAYMSGKLKVVGNMSKAMKLENLIGVLKSKL
ncbi:putative NAD-dependent oxidoreductase [Armadillidium nasatum]|uniref:Hydroxysteroid dehydrogenase-like protein 2 n=1 Tax=Armadillidium nasatum TaxID=96803 RepID=A0A5N5SX46_9CRUS|nr:putative NAD-dependent oxidoreductase [Armadillidium nasatum]